MLFRSLQLVRANVSHYNPQKRQLVTGADIDAHLKREFLPTKATLAGSDLAVFLACTGDATDGIKPIGGIGPVTLGQYYEKLPEGLPNPAKLDALSAIASEVKKGAGQLADWSQARANLQATDLDTARQHDIVLGSIPEPRPNKDAFRQVLEELTMQSFLNQYEQWFAPFEAKSQPSLSIN